MSAVPYSNSTPPKMVITIHRNTDQTRVFDFYTTEDEDVEIDVEARYSDFALEVRTQQNPNTTRLLRYTLGDGLEITSNNKLTLTIPKEDTASIEGGVYWYDLICENTQTNSVYALAQGRFEINNNVSFLENIS